ncbi:hypothetical protein WK91_18370 [Burkholderia cepacia]|uniref:hypothetical protein n=1 Tax=Burkholderia cepacia TaxID=292 RepID=UPI00075868DC|nr:hypothetical protein [Burkholderia cepacia]KVW15402.1 hypothetical protein WK91_18370 [Burkholderia cepacia]
MNDKRYRIISDGTPRGTKVLQPDGSEMSNVVKVEWEITGDSPGIARVTLIGVEVDVVGDEHPCASEVSLDARADEVKSSDGSRP